MLVVKDIKENTHVYELERSTFPSSDGKNKVAFYVFKPKGREPRAVVQLCHGMCEYLLRYEPLAAELCKRGIVFCGNDHLGHGHTAKCDEDLGFTAEKGGADFMVKDVLSLTGIMKERYKSLPVVLVGHSMGSFIARLYIERYSSEISAAVIVGTGGPEAPAVAGKLLAGMIVGIKGKRHRSPLLEGLAFGNYNKRFKGETVPHAWITRDEAVRIDYESDKFRNYKFTSVGFYDLFGMLAAVSRRSWAKSIRKDLPMLVMSGENDPVGNYGKGVRRVYGRLERAGIKDLTLRMYPDCRHELFSETNRDEIIKDTADWIDEKLARG